MYWRAIILLVLFLFLVWEGVSYHVSHDDAKTGRKWTLLKKVPQDQDDDSLSSGNDEDDDIDPDDALV